jgi:DNA-binding beta-propeller fold protein YncE
VPLTVKAKILYSMALVLSLVPVLGTNGCDYSYLNPLNDPDTDYRDVSVHGTVYELEYVKTGLGTEIRVFRLNPDGSSTEIQDQHLIQFLDGLDHDIVDDRGSYPLGDSLVSRARAALGSKASAPATPKVYVLDTVNLFQIDTAAVQISNSLDLTAGQPGAPSRMAVTPDGAFAVISNINRPNQPYILIVDLAAFKIVATISIPENANAYGVAVTPDNKFAYVVTESLANAQNSVYVIDLTARQIATTIALPKYQGLTNIVMTPDGTEAYLNSCCGTDFQIPVIDIFTNTVALDVPTYYYSQATNIVLLDAPAYIAMHPDGSRVYLAPIDGTPIHVLDTATNVVTKRIAVPQGPASPAGTKPVFTPDGRFLFVLDGPAAISVIDTKSDTLFSTIPLNSAFASQPPGSTKLTFFFVPDP